METKLLPLGPTARRLRIPANWLREQAEAGKIPHLKAGRALLFEPEIVERILLLLARGEAEAVKNG